VPLFNGDTGDQDGTCWLSTAPQTIDPNFGDETLRLSSSGHFSYGRMVLIGTATFLGNATITISCTGFNWFIENPAIVATKVGLIHF
jgi:hypothetical protein